MHKVAVVTRTKDRPLLLERALSSIASQTMKDILWVVVNDGGHIESVDAIVDRGRGMGLAAKVVHHAESLGMEAASNAGILSSESEYLVIHDDDDSWKPDFLRLCLGFLEEKTDYVGVATQCWRVDEEIRGDQVVTLKKTEFNPWLRSLYLIEVAKVNSFPPISLVYRRTAIEEIGLYDESMPVLGDWDFNLRLLERFDIGVIPLPLANYHHRAVGNESAYGNSLYAGRMKHIEHDALFRNKLLRKDLKTGRVGIGFLVSIGRMQQSSLAEQLALNMGRIFYRFGFLRKLWKW